MTALGTVSAPTLAKYGANAGKVSFTQVANADTYQIKVYPKAPKTSVDYDLADAEAAMTITRTPGTGATSQIITFPPDFDNPTHLYKVTVIAKDSTLVKTDSVESAASSAVALTEIEEANEDEESVVAETINPFTGEAFRFAGSQAHSQVAYTRQADGTVSQVLSDATGAMGTQAARAGTQKTRQRDAGLVTAAKSLASDLPFKLTDPSDHSGGVAVVDPVAKTVSTPANTSEDTAIVGEGSIVNFTDRRADEVGAADVVYGAGKSF